MAEQADADEFSDDDLSAVEEEEFTDDDLAAAKADTGPTFYLRDTSGAMVPVSADIARQARELGATVFSGADVKAQQAPPQKATSAESPPPAADPGLARTLGRGFLQGFLKQGADEATGAIGRLHDVGPGARYRMGDGTTRPVETKGDMYRAVREDEREIERGAREHWAAPAFVANMAGDLASDAALQYLGVPVTSTPYQVASGALSGFLGSDAELSTDTVEPGAAASAAGSTALGAGLGYVMPKVGTAVARALPGALARLRSGFESSALDKARKVLTAGSGQLARRKPVSDAAAREALDTGAIPIWGTTEGAFQRLKETAAIRGKTYADILEELQAAGVEGPRVEPLARRLAREGDDQWKNSGANKSIANVFTSEAENIRAVKPEIQNTFQIVGEGPRAVTGPRLPPTPAAAPVETAVLTPPPSRKTPVSDLPETKVGRRPTEEKTEVVEMLRVRGEGGKYLPRDKRWAREGHTVIEKNPLPADAGGAAPEVRYDAPPVAPPAKPLKKPIQGPTIESLPLAQAERIKRQLQKDAKYDKIQATGLDEAKQEVASMYREAIEQAVDEAGAAASPGSEVANLAERFVPTKRQLAATIEARDAAERGAGAAAHRVGGAAGVNLFDVANASQASGTKGLPALALAAAGRIWKERGPSTLANVYDLSAEAAGNLSRAARTPAGQSAVANYLVPASARQVAGSGTVERALADYLMRRRAEGSGS
jgi:hypothetical protein